MRQDISHSFKVEMPWMEGDTIRMWNEVCAGAIEDFGLPGCNYSTEVSTDAMIFYFKNEKDAVLFALKWL